MPFLYQSIKTNKNYLHPHAQTTKNVLKGIGAGAVTAASIAVVVVTGGKINPKK